MNPQTLTATRVAPTVMPQDPGELQVFVLEGGVEVVEQLAADWVELSARASNNKPFYRPEWVAAYLRAFAKKAEVVVYAARACGQLVGILPMVRDQRWFYGLQVRRLRSASNVHSCRFDLLRAAGPKGEAAVLAIWNRMKASADWDLIEFRDVPQGGALQLLQSTAGREGFQTAKEDSIDSPYVTLEPWRGDWDWWLHKLKGKFRSNVRRRKKKLEERGQVTLERVVTAERKHLEDFYDIERSGWKGMEGTAIALDSATRQFYDEIAAAAERAGYFSLYFLDLDGKHIAGHFGLNYAGRYYVPKLAYREEFDQYSPGHLLVNAVLRDCAERGLSEFDFVGPMMDWKSEWTPKFRRHRVLFVCNQGAFGRVLHFLRFGAKRQVKRLLGRSQQ